MQSIYELREGTPGSTAALMAPLADLVAGTASAEAALEPTLTAALARGLEALADTGRDELESLGLSRLEARRLQLCARLARPIATDGADQPTPIPGPADVLAHVQDLRTAPQERDVALYLDARNRPLGRELVSVGGRRFRGVDIVVKGPLSKLTPVRVEAALNGSFTLRFEAGFCNRFVINDRSLAEASTILSAIQSWHPDVAVRAANQTLAAVLSAALPDLTIETLGDMTSTTAPSLEDDRLA